MLEGTFYALFGGLFISLFYGLISPFLTEAYFPEFMAFFFPDAYADIDWTRAYTFLDKELQKVVRASEIGRRHTDKLVQVYRQDGGETWILVHIEVQGQKEAGFAERMYIYNYRLFDRYRRQVVSLAVLTDEHPSWRPSQYQSALWGCRVTLDFPTIKLLDYQENVDALVENPNPFAIVVLAHLQTQATRHQPEARYAAKLSLITKVLYQRGYGRQDVLELFRFIDWLLTLSPVLAQQFRTDLEAFEAEAHMQYVTSVERLAREEGKQLATREGIVRILNVRFGHASSEIVEMLNKIDDVERLEILHEQAITIESLVAFGQLLTDK